MIEIVPAILPKNYEDLKDKIALVRGYASIVQIDICDGIFVKNKTWPFLGEGELDLHFHKILNEQQGMPFWEDIDFELDLMVSDALQNFDIYTKLGPRRIIFHLEAVGNLEEFKDFLEAIDPYIKDSIEFGVAIGLNSKVEDIFPFISVVDFVQIMGISEIGFQGQDFNEKAIEYVKIIREKFSDVLISVDGGINFENAPSLVKVGVNRLAIGSAILNSNDIIGTIEEFKNL